MSLFGHNIRAMSKTGIIMYAYGTNLMHVQLEACVSIDARTRKIHMFAIEL